MGPRPNLYEMAYIYKVDLALSSNACNHAMDLPILLRLTPPL